MKSNLAFLKKEFKEIFHTYKIWVIPAIFLFFGFLSPVTAKLAPELIKSQAIVQKIKIEIPPATILDSYGQYFKNLLQLGFLAVILFSMGLVSEEKAKGTLQMVITKPVSRSAVIFSKLVAQNTLILSSTILGALACHFYTVLLFNQGKILEFTQAIFLILVYYFLVISISLFFSSILNNPIGAGGLTLLTLIILYFLPYLSSKLEKYTPSGLTTTIMEIMKGQTSLSQKIWPITASSIGGMGLILLGCLIFNRQEL